MVEKKDTVSQKGPAERAAGPPSNAEKELKVEEEVDTGRAKGQRWGRMEGGVDGRLASIQRQQQRQRNGTSTDMSNSSVLSLPAKKLVHKAQGTP